jgi:hypothetical protein
VLAIVSITLSSCPLPAVLHNFWPTTKINDWATYVPPTAVIEKYGWVT